MRTLLVAAWLAVVAAAPAAAAQAPSPGAPPPLLGIVRLTLKPRTSGIYTGVESQTARAYERDRVRVFWIGLQSPKDSNDILYLGLHDSAEAADKTAERVRDALSKHADLTQLLQRAHELTANQTSTLTTRRDDVERADTSVDFATMRMMRVTTFRVQPGREGEFVQALRTSNPKDGSWLVYEANDSSTFLLLTLKKTSLSRKDGPPIPRNVRRVKGLYTSAESQIYAVRPSLSRVSQAFAAINPQFWHPQPAIVQH